MDEEVPEFSSTEAECAFWKQRAHTLKTEYDEFTEDSTQLEKELEITIKLKDDQLTDLRRKYNRQQHDNDSLTAKLKQCENELLQWEQRYKKEKAEAEVLRKHTRELEQKNDDLERAHRIVSESVTEFERMLNREYEKNVMLEVEYEMEKENAQIQLQRLMDEARDLKQELKIQQKVPGSQREGGEDEGGHDEQAKDNKEIPDKELMDPQVQESATEEKAALEMSSSDRRDSNKQESQDNLTNGLMVNGTSSNGHAGTAADTTPLVTKSSMTRSAAATMQRENSLKQMDRLKNGSSMTASSRSTALAIVADLLRRVNECLQLDTKLVCVQCKTLQCECPPSVERRSISSLQDSSTLLADSIASPRFTAVDSSNNNRGSRFNPSIAPDTAVDDRPAAIRLASILGIGRTGTADQEPSRGSSSSRVQATPRKPSNSSEVKEIATSSPAANWFKDKYQMATNKLMSSKNIDATLKELKRPKSMDEDLADDDGTTTTAIHSQSEKAKSPSLIC